MKSEVDGFEVLNISYYKRCWYLADSMSDFLEWYNFKFFRSGSYIIDMYNMSLVFEQKLLNIPDLTDEESYKKLYDEYKIFYEYKVKQYQEFAGFDKENL